MSLRRSAKPRRGGEAGQALTEAVIALCLLALTWVILFFTTYMSNHSIRTAVAARHAAWSLGNGKDVSAASLATDVFFTNTDLVSLTTRAERSTSSEGLLSSGGNPLLDVLFNIFPDIQKADVKFGIDGMSNASSYPFILMRGQIPFMPDAIQTNWFNVSTHCEWDTVTETWSSLGSMLQSIVEGFLP